MQSLDGHVFLRVPDTNMTEGSIGNGLTRPDAVKKSGKIEGRVPIRCED